MGKYMHYDPEQHVIMVDHTDQILTREVMAEVLQEYKETCAGLPQKVYVVVCWKNTKLSPDLGDYYATIVEEVLKYVKGIVRYEANDFLTTITIRAQTIRHNLQHSQSNIYPSKEAALEAVRKLEAVGSKKPF
jgi:hypothetical protein